MHRDGSPGSDVTSKALQEYLMHQKASRLASMDQRVRGTKKREGAGAPQGSLMRVEQLATKILGTGRPGRSRGAMREVGSGGEGRRGETPKHKSEQQIVNVIGKLQKEISLDTQAISAFRGEMASVLAKESSKTAATKLKSSAPEKGSKKHGKGVGAAREAEGNGRAGDGKAKSTNK